MMTLTNVQTFPVVTILARTAAAKWRVAKCVAFSAVCVCVCPQLLPAQTKLQERSLQLLQTRYEETHATFAKQLREIADICESRSFVSEAEELRTRALPVSAGAYDLDALPVETQPRIPPNLPTEDLQWQTRLRKVESDYALELYRLSREALRRGHPSLAFQLIREVAFHDPDHRQARRMLGYVRDGETWTTLFELQMSRRGMIDHPQFGWILERYAPRYEAGERLFNGAWISVEKEAALRADFRYAWEVQTEHFLIRTNHSLEKGVEISRLLENYHRFFVREYTAFFNSKTQMERLFDAGTTSRSDPSPQFQITYFRNREEFLTALRPRQPNIERANGLYLPSDRIAYFYYDEEAGDSASETMYHEVAHQFLGESTSRPVAVGETADFWVIEGFPTYLESYQPQNSEQPVGDPGHIRIRWARQYALEDRIYVPLRDFCSLGKNAFQNPADPELLHAFYSQAAGVVHFFLHYDNGVYRDAFIQYLSRVYSPVDRIRLKGPSLEQFVGVSYETLDQQYFQHLRTLPLAANPAQDPAQQ